MTPDKLPVYSTWQLKEHDNIERPYWEITNGPISMCVDDEDIEEEHITAMKEIVSALNSGGIKFRSENTLEFKLHIDIMKLQTEVADWKREYDELQTQAQRMADALDKCVQFNKGDYAGKYLNVLFNECEEALQKFKDGNGIIKNEVCTCDNIQLAAHGECWACPGRLTKDGKEKEVSTDKNKPMKNKELTTSYTKGEWYLQEYTDAYTNIVRCNNGKGHETLFIAHTPQSPLPEARANAKLMSAAPDLLKALQEIIAITDRDHTAWAKAKAAIEKAIGK